MSDTRKRDRTPYATIRYKQTSKLFKTVYHRCWVVDGNGHCWRQGTVPDHVPPISTFPDPQLWHGELKPMCLYHSRRQSGLLRHGKTYRPQATRKW